MAWTTTHQVGSWIRDRGGLEAGLPALRSEIKAGQLSRAEVALVRDYLAELDSVGRAPVEAAAVTPPAPTQDEVRLRRDAGTTALALLGLLLSGLTMALMRRPARRVRRAGGGRPPRA